MAQTGFTPISLYYSSVPGNVPDAADLVFGELGLNIAEGALYYKDAGGTVERLNSGSGPTFSATGDNLQTVPSGVFTKIDFNLVAFDSSLSYDPTLSRFTAPTKGYYQVSACIQCDISPLGGKGTISLFKNGAQYSDGNAIELSTTEETQLVLSTVVFLNGTGDYIEIFGEQTSGADLQMGAPGPYTAFSGISYGIPSGVTPPPNEYTIDYLVIGGGGGGGGGQGGGGGGGSGQFVQSTTLGVVGNVYTVLIGAGGPYGQNGTAGGTTSVLGLATAVGGGGGGLSPNQNDGGHGANSGSGYVGGAGHPDIVNGGRGGGGAGSSADGGTATPYATGNGGAGTNSIVTGTSEYYAGGGGGAGQSSGAGGIGGGGYGATPYLPGSSGALNTGSGGGGGTNAAGGNGGTGVVIFSMPTSRYSGVVTGSPTIYTSGLNTIIVFTASGSYTA